MRIGIDAGTLFLPNLRGIGKYLYNLLHNLAEIDNENSYFLYHENDHEINRVPEYNNFTGKTITIWKGSRLYLWEQLRLPLAAKSHKIDVFHSPGNTAILLKQCPTVVTIHDTILQELIKNYNVIQRLYFNKFQPFVLRNADAVIVNSVYTKKCAIQVFGIQEEKISVIYLGLNDRFKKIEKTDIIQNVKVKYSIKGSYIFALGADAPWKNTIRLLQAYADLKRNTNIKHCLVIAGIQKRRDEYLQEISSSGFQNDVIFLQYIPEDDLIALYNGADIFVYPSLFEGFGFPPLEAMACGVPVVASNASVIPETVGDAAHLVDARDKNELAKAIQEVLSNDNLKYGLIKKGFQRITQFSWRKTAEETLKVYRQLEKRQND